MTLRKNLLGEKFTRLEVVQEVVRNKHGAVRWLCSCECGGTTIVVSGDLLRGNTKSCGCFKIDEAQKRIKHGLASIDHHGKKSIEYRLHAAAKHRAKKQNLPFNLDIQDIEIPATCPVFGFPLKKDNTRFRFDSPTVDRLVPEKGYVKDNISITSFKANLLKNDATKEEIQRLLEWMEKQ